MSDAYPYPVPRFEDEYPEAARFMMQVYATGGRINLRYRRVTGLRRNDRCPCGSGQKVKRCHTWWATR